MTPSRFIYLHPPYSTRHVKTELAVFLTYQSGRRTAALTRGAARAASLLQLGGNDLERHQPVLADDSDRKLRADAGLDHEPLQVAGPGHRRAVNLDDQVSAAQPRRGGGAVGHHLLHLDARLEARALGDRWGQGSRAAGDAEERPANASVAPERREERLRRRVDRDRKAQ